MNAVLTNESQQEKQHSEGIGFQLWGHGPLEDRAKAEQILLAMFFTSQTHIYKKTHLIRMMTDGVWAIAPTRLQAQMIHRKMRKASWQPGTAHFPGTAVANALWADIQLHPVRFCRLQRKRGWREKKKVRAPLHASLNQKQQTRIMQLKKEVVQKQCIIHRETLQKSQ